MLTEEDSEVSEQEFQARVGGLVGMLRARGLELNNSAS